MKNLREHQHFSHHHALAPLKLDEGEELNCNGCDAQIQEPFHGCISCSFFLHDTCLNTPRFLQHPFHSHPLTLLPTPTYPTRSFLCNACGSEGKSFSFTCAQCECDLHIKCAALPPTLHLPDQHHHALKLIFRFPYEGPTKVTFVCSMCDKESDPNHWVYYCPACDFGLDLACATPSKTGSSSSAGVEKREKNIVENDEEDQHEALSLEEEMAILEIKRKGRKNILESVDPYTTTTRYYYY